MNIPVKSDSYADNGITYVVTLDEQYNAIRCTCPAWKRCKHMRRAEVLPAFVAARDALGYSPEQAKAHYDRLVDAGFSPIRAMRTFISYAREVQGVAV